MHSSSSQRKKLTLIDADGLAAGVAVFGKHRVEAMQAIGSAVPHDVPLAAQTSVALEASKVLHVPSPAFSLRALVSKNYLKQSKGVKFGSSLIPIPQSSKENTNCLFVLVIILILIS